MKKLTTTIFTLILILLLYPTTSVQAATTGDFTVTPIIDNTNNNRNVNMYFDLLLKPSEKKKLTIVVNNKSDKTENFTVEANQATTSNSGIIDYGEFKNINKLNNKFEKIVDKRTQNITIPAHTSKDIDLTVTMPKKEFSGMILGGFHVYKMDTTTSNAKNIKNTFAYNIAIVLRNNNQIPNSKLSLTDAKITIDPSLASLKYSLVNNSTKIEPKLHIKSQLYRKNNKQPMISNSSNNITIAPQSKINYSIKPTNKYLYPGKYQLKVTAKNKSKTYHFSKNLTVTQKQAQAINTKSGINKPINWMCILSGIIVSLLIIVTYLIIRLRSKQRR